MGTIQLRNLTKEFNEVRAVDDISLDIDDGEFLVLVGPSGCGKSTLLRLIAGLEKATGGAILFDGEEVTDLEPRDRDIAMVFQNYALYPQMTVEQNLAFGLKVRKRSKDEIKERVQRVAKVLRLDALLGRKPRQLSGGQRQRVAMGRAMVREPAAYLMDEPLSNLDTKLRVAMRAELARLHERLGVTTIYVTHDQVEALTLGDRVAVMGSGVIQQIDSPQHLFDNPANMYVAGFIGSPAINLVEAVHVEGRLTFATFSIPVPQGYRLAEGQRVILGIRPSDLSRVDSDQPNSAMMRVRIEASENLGTESYAFFVVDAPAIESDASASGSASFTEESRLLAEGANTCLFVAVLPIAKMPGVGDEVLLAAPLDRLHLFDPSGGAALARDASLG